MTDADLDALTSQLAKTRVGPTGVSFEGRSLKLDTEEDAKEVIEAIKACANLEYLNLGGNTLGVDAAKGIAKALESHKEFKKALWNDMFTGRMKEEIPEALRFLGSGLVLSTAQLSELDLSDNAFGPIGVEGLAVLLRSSVCYQLQILKLNNNGLGINGGKMLAKALLDCYKNSTEAGGQPLGLKVFIAGRNRLENDGAKALAEVFKTVGTLEEVCMPQNGIYHVGITALCNAFAVNRNLRILNLNDNTIREMGASSIASALTNLQKLEHLNLGDSLLKTKGAHLLADALSEGHPELKELHLGYNEINADGGIALAKAMRNKSKLKVLNLGGNNFGEKGIKNLRSELMKSGRLDALDNMSDDEGTADEEDDSDDDEEEEEDENGGDDDEYEDIEEEEVIGEQESVDDNLVSSTSEGEFNSHSKENKDLKQQRDSVIDDGIPVSVKEFLSSSSAENFLKLGDDRKKKLLVYVKESGNEMYVERLLEVLMKVSALSTHKMNNVSDSALSCSDTLFSELFRWGVENHQTSYITNALLVNLGLLKSEDKGFSVTWNLGGCFSALHHAIQKDYFPSSARESIKIFLQRQVPAKIEEITLN